MTTLLHLAWHSLRNRRLPALLTIFAIACSVTLLLGVERIGQGARHSFASTVSGTDLVVGARSGPVQLLLYSVFHLGDPTHNLRWESYQKFAAHPEVAWSIPLTLGDSHRGYAVLGTNTDYFQYYRFSAGRPLIFREGQAFHDLFEVVLGAEVADKLGYRLGQNIVISHGSHVISHFSHDDKPFRVSGILARTGTPVDHTLHVSLYALEAIHADWRDGAPPLPGQNLSAEAARALDLTPRTITAFMLGLKSKLGIFAVQREINQYPDEALSAILPGVTLQQLWGLVGLADNALKMISAFVVLVGLLGMTTVILTSLDERRREMAILRSVGARPWHIFGLLQLEALLLAVLGAVLGVALLYLGQWLATPLFAAKLGLWLPMQGLSAYEWRILAALALCALLLGALPAWRAYRNALADGLAMRL
jgi:putative ABC transport system permease protein